MHTSKMKIYIIATGLSDRFIIDCVCSCSCSGGLHAWPSKKSDPVNCELIKRGRLRVLLDEFLMNRPG